MRECIIKALRNYGYRLMENKNGCYAFGKPIGYGMLRAQVRDDENAVTVIMVVGPNPFWNWKQVSQGFMEEDDEQKMYEIFVQAIADCEADLFSKTAVAWSQNRDVRYDFEENDVLDE